MSQPGDAIRNSVTRRSLNNNPIAQDENNYLPNHGDNSRVSNDINNVKSRDTISSREEKTGLLANHEGSTELEVKFMKRDGLKPIHFGAYAVGHVYNDLCATCWFLYLLFFLTDIRKWSEAKAGFAVLSGQIADGLATQFVGYMSDKFNPRIGKRALWYLIGFAIVLPCFFGTLNECLICVWACGDDNTDGDDPHPKCTDSAHDNLRLAYYLILPALFNIGWAAVQISTMSVVVSISQSQTRRDRLVSLRNGFTYVSSLSVLILAAIFFRIIDDPTEKFKVLMYVVTCVGVCMSIFYIVFVGIQEVRLTNDAQYYDQIYRRKGQTIINRSNNDPANPDGSPEHENNDRNTMSDDVKQWSGWLKEGAFYVHGAVYMFARLAMNLTMTAIPFYLKYVLLFTDNDGDEDDNLSETPIEIALVPLCSYFCSIVFSIFLYQRMLVYFGNRLMPLLIGTILVCVSSTPFLFMQPSFRWMVYICSGVQGIGLATLLNTATSLISDVIGDDEESSAFVYGSYSLLDKF
jgi:Na+/melibiose symporter-like transporter